MLFRKGVGKMALQRCRCVFVGLCGAVGVALHRHACGRVAGPPLGDVVGHARVGHRGDREVPQSVEGQPGRDLRGTTLCEGLVSDLLGGRPQDPLYEPSAEHPTFGTDEHEGFGVGVGTSPIPARCRASSSIKKVGAASVRRL